MLFDVEIFTHMLTPEVHLVLYFWWLWHGFMEM